MRHPSHSLQLPRPGVAAEPSTRPRRRRRRRSRGRLQQAGLGLLLLLGGSGILALLMLLPGRLDALLLVSNAIVNLIRGLQQLGLSLLQLAMMLTVVMLALLALLLLIGGAVRLLRALLPGRSTPSAGP